MTASPVQRDERTVTAESRAFRWAYLFISFGLLALVAYRSFAWRESPWDLLLLVVLGGAVPAAYQGYHEVRPTRWALRMFAAAAIAALVGATLVLIR